MSPQRTLLHSLFFRFLSSVISFIFVELKYVFIMYCNVMTGYGLDGPGIETRWGARFSTPVQICPGAHPASCTMDTGSFPGVKSDQDVSLTPHSLLVPWSWMSRAILLLPLWAVRPVQNLSACTRVYFTLKSRLFEVVHWVLWQRCVLDGWGIGVRFSERAESFLHSLWRIAEACRVLCVVVVVDPCQGLKQQAVKLFIHNFLVSILRMCGRITFLLSSARLHVVIQILPGLSNGREFDFPQMPVRSRGECWKLI
jgi:hypothetical protein